MATRIALLAALVTLAIVPAANAATALTPWGGVAGDLGTRFVAWSARERVHARSLRSGRDLSWPVPAGQTYVLGLAIVGRHLLVTVTGGPFGGPGTGGFTVYRARLF